MNLLVATGNLGKDAEIRYTETQKPVINFSVPMSAGWGDRKQTIWLNCSMWGDRGLKLADYLKKGKMVCVSGELSTREYESSGEKRVSHELNVKDVTLCGGREESAAPMTEMGKANAAATAKKEQATFDDDIQF